MSKIKPKTKSIKGCRTFDEILDVEYGTQGTPERLWTILVPSIKPAVVVVAMMLFIQIWNDMLQQLIYINSMSKFTFAVALTNFTGSFGTNWPVALAATFMTILPGIVIYFHPATASCHHLASLITFSGGKNHHHHPLPGRA